MKELKIDEKYINVICNNLTLLMKHIVQDMESLCNKNNDKFNRYMSMVRLLATLKGSNNALDLSNQSFGMGFDIQHEYFQTPSAKENEWDKVKIEENPFFVNEQKVQGEIKIELKELPGELKEIIMSAIKKKIADEEVNNPIKH